MASASGSPWKTLVLPVLVTGLCIWLAYCAIATGMAGYHENRGEGDRALGWRANSPLALAIKADRLVRRDDHTVADAMARRALRRSSLRADALRTLALSASARGRANEALTLMSQAGRLNPRDGETQSWLFERAVARGDYRRAVLHADGLMRRSPQAWTPLSFTLATRLGDSTVRAALAQRLSADPSWRGTFLSIAARKGADADVAALFQALKGTASPVTDAEATAFFNRLVAEAKYRQAKGYFDAFVSGPGWAAALVYDGGFAGRPGPPPLNWKAIPALGGSARWALDDGAPLGNLRLSHDGFSSSGALVGQLILLSPGFYQVAARARIDDPVADGRFKVQVACASGPGLVSMTLRGAPGSWVPSRAGFTVPPETCEAQWLLIVPVTGDRREMAEMLIDDIVVRRVVIGPLPRKEPDWTP
ncbi:MAG: hypothetical protein Q7T19_16255 [Caulobacter sp.]|nr:hypothetical protein [Caulobacter sp.]